MSKTRNIKPHLEGSIAPFVERVLEQSYVCGLVFLGGLGTRNFLDRFSDIDIAIFVRRRDKQKVSLPFEFYHQVGTRVLEFNVRYLVLEDEEKPSNLWDLAKTEAYSRGRVIYDPDGRVERLIEMKARFDFSRSFKRLIWIVHQFQWRGQIHALRCCERGYPESGHDLLNQCVDLLIEAAYLVSGRYMPHRKWRLVYLEDMETSVAKLMPLFKDAMLVRSFCLENVKERIGKLNRIFDILLPLIRNNFPEFPEDPYAFDCRNRIQITSVGTIEQLVERLSEELNEVEKKKLQGFLCFNVIETEEELRLKLSKASQLGEQLIHKVSVALKKTGFR